MIRNSLRMCIGLLATTCLWAVQAAAATWVDTDKISNSRNLQIQIDVDSINYKKDWIYVSQRVQNLEDSQAYKPYNLSINCSRGILVEIFPNAGEETQFRRNDRWFIDFANKNDPSDVINIEIKADDDKYRERTYTLVCKKYKR